MLCELAHAFPSLVAELLERDRTLKRNFREETVTDLLMASLVGLRRFGIRVDFPDEPTTGGDMEWIYAAPLEQAGGRYLRVILQAKRAQYAKLKGGGYWFYHHLAHGSPPGDQANTLMQHAAGTPGTLPLYVFYHPTSALEPSASGLPAVEGVNLVFASLVAPVVKGGCGRPDKTVARWRPHLLSLSDLLCWPVLLTGLEDPSQPGATQFLVVDRTARSAVLTGGFHPDIVAGRFRARRRQTTRPEPDLEMATVEPADGIPADIRRAIEDNVSAEDRHSLKRPRVILTTSLRRETAAYQTVQMFSGAASQTS